MSLQLLFDARPLIDANSGGVRRVTEMILASLLNADPELRVVCATTGMKKPKLPDPFAAHPRIEHVHLRIPNKLWSLLAMLKITSLDRAIIKKERGFGIWGLGVGKPNPKPQTPTSVLLPNLGFTGPIKTPYALILHDLSFLIEPRWFPWKMRLWHLAINPKEMARRAQIIFCVSETTARDAERLLGIPREKIRVFSPGIPEFGKREAADEKRKAGSGEQEAEEEIRLPFTASRSPYVLALGGDDPRKNTATAIAAVEMLRREEAFRDLKLVVVESRKAFGYQLSAIGRITGALAESRKPIAESPFLIPLPRQSDAELADLYQRAAAFLYPSWYEGFGLPLHEAARYGTPCIASTWGALPETAPQGTVFAPPAKPHLWASTLRDILAAPERYRTRFDEHAAKTDIGPIIEWLKGMA